MRITITNDAGEVFATMRDLERTRHGIWAGTDDEGDPGVTLDSILQEAAQDELEELARPHERENR